MWSNGIKIALFSKKLQKIAQRLGVSPPDPIASGGWGLRPQTPLCDTFDLQYTCLLNMRLPIYTFSHFNYCFKPYRLNKSLVMCQHQATASDLRFYDIFAPQKILLSKFLMTSLHVICGLGPPKQKFWLRLWS